MDIAALTIKKKVDVIVLVSGDSDFVSTTKFSRKKDFHLYLVTLEKYVKSYMSEYFFVEDSPVLHHKYCQPSVYNVAGYCYALLFIWLDS